MSQRFRFGPFVLEIAERRLSRDGREIHAWSISPSHHSGIACVLIHASINVSSVWV